MNTHKNARLTTHGRALLLASSRPRKVVQAQDISVRTVYKWVHRFREEGLEDRRPHPVRGRLSADTAKVEHIVERRQIYRQIAQALVLARVR